MMHEDIASDLEASEDLAGRIHKALVSAAAQGEAIARGKADVLVERYDNAYAEWRITCEESGELSKEAMSAHATWRTVCQDIVGELVELVRSEGT